MISSSDIFNGKILIVDDKEANIILLERMLRGAGYTSISSTMDPTEVCALHLNNRYDLILLDIQMPSLDGFQVMEGLKETEPQDLLLELPLKQQFQALESLDEIEPGGYLPVIVITAHPGHKLHAFQSGARDFISKPFELAEVLARVRNMLEMRLLHLETKNYINALEQKIMEIKGGRNLIHRQSAGVKHRGDKTTPTEVGGAATLAQPRTPVATRLRTILYVEDDPANLKLVEQIIARRPDIRLLTATTGDSGIEIARARSLRSVLPYIEATTGNSGIEIARASLPEVILMDINLPDINGIEALKILRSDPATAHIPVIAVSANAMPLDIERGVKAGFFHYITKPIKVDEFMEALNSALKYVDQQSEIK